MARKKFRIEYETWERTQSGEVCKLAPKSQKSRKVKTKTGDRSLEDYARQCKLNLVKDERNPSETRSLSLSEYEESYM